MADRKDQDQYSASLLFCGKKEDQWNADCRPGVYICNEASASAMRCWRKIPAGAGPGAPEVDELNLLTPVRSRKAG